MCRLFKFNVFILCAICFCNCQSQINQRIDLSGEWQFAIDSCDVGECERWFDTKLSQSVTMPGTMDTNLKGIKNEAQDETKFLSRKFIYDGKAWYQREVTIPKGWKGQRVELFIERTKPSTLYVDGVKVDSIDYISTPHSYDITNYVESGESHTISVVVDNSARRIPPNSFNSHANSDHTQTRWNGMVGTIELRAKSEQHIAQAKLTPSVSDGVVKNEIIIGGTLIKGANYFVDIQAYPKGDSKLRIAKQTVAVNSNAVCFDYEMGEDFALWSEHTPNLYTYDVTLRCDNKVLDKATYDIGMREFTAEGIKLYNNGKRVFLRGKHDAAVFPLTAYADMSREGWRRYLQICKKYGLNHIRFHSWCPPKACMEMADSMGVYLEIELPLWGTINKDDERSVKFLEAEAANILDNYANHPSVVLFTLGNELFGDMSKLNRVVKGIKAERPELLTATGSNNRLGNFGSTAFDDFFVTCRTKRDAAFDNFDNHTRASFSYVDAHNGGIINTEYPSTMRNFDTAISKGAKVPIIGHETGQYQCFPNFAEIEKYSGALEPRNFETFKKRLDEAGLLPLSDQFFRASGAFQTLLYKADIEMNLRSDLISGFQLLDLQDYTGQGTALVGVLDAFMDSKGFITHDQWRTFCSEVVPLVEMEKYCYRGGDSFAGNALIYNYGGSDLDGEYSWQLIDENDIVVESGAFDVSVDESTLGRVGRIEFQMPSPLKATRYTLAVNCERDLEPNSYNIWVYPPQQEAKAQNAYSILHRVDNELYRRLESGERVLLIPSDDELSGATIDGMFTTDYWNYRMFKRIADAKNRTASPGTLGLLIDEKHKIFDGFPTDFHSDMQWFPIVSNSRPLILDNLPNLVTPIVRVIDNFERNHSLALIFECQVGKGKLFVVMSDLLSLPDSIEAQSVLTSIKGYVGSDAFLPTFSCSIDDLQRVFTALISDAIVGDLKNVSYK